MSELTYLASPYSNSDPQVREDRFRAACIAVGYFMYRGEHVFSPIAHSHSVALHCELPTEWYFWQQYDRFMIDMCSSVRVLMLPNWEDSVGIKAELEMAVELGKPVSWWYFSDGLPTISQGPIHDYRLEMP
jgi:hypothetical protein